jgi:predicted RNase H-like nuclease (RuvC/YqgF family)
MNEARRKQITAAHTALEALKDKFSDLQCEAEDLQSTIESIRDEEQEYFDNMPESIQQGEKGQNAEQAVAYLEESLEVLTAVVEFDFDGFDTALEALDNSTNA